MSNFQVTIIPGKTKKSQESTEEKIFEGNQKSPGGKSTIENIESLEEVWDEVVGKLSLLASKTVDKTEQYELNEIEFNIGIEAGLNIGLVTKGNASVAIKFKKKT